MHFNNWFASSQSAFERFDFLNCNLKKKNQKITIFVLTFAKYLYALDLYTLDLFYLQQKISPRLPPREFSQNPKLTNKDTILETIPCNFIALIEPKFEDKEPREIISVLNFV